MARRNWDGARRRDPVRERGGDRVDKPYDDDLYTDDPGYYRSGGGQSRPKPKSNEQLKREFLERERIRRQS